MHKILRMVYEILIIFLYKFEYHGHTDRWAYQKVVGLVNVGLHVQPVEFCQIYLYYFKLQSDLKFSLACELFYLL